MAATQQKAAQQRLDRIAAFRSELDSLEEEGALALFPEQRAKLQAHHKQLLEQYAARYGLDTTEARRRVSWAMRIGSLLFAAALAAALILFLHRVWGWLTWPVQVSIPVLVPLGLLMATQAAARREIGSYYVSLLAVATQAAFVLAIVTLGAIWNATPTGHVLLAWASLAVCLAYAFENRLLLGVGLILGCGYVGALWLMVNGEYWVDFLDRPAAVLCAGAFVYCVPWLRRAPIESDFDGIYRMCGAGVGLIALLALSKGDDLCCATGPAQALELGFQLAGLVLSAIVVLHGLRLSRSGLVNLGAAGFVAFLYVRLQAWFWDWLPKYVFCLLIAAVSLGLILLFRRLRQRLGEGAAA